jgi:hypothetical protein
MVRYYSDTRRSAQALFSIATRSTKSYFVLSSTTPLENLIVDHARLPATVCCRTKFSQANYTQSRFEADGICPG